MAEHLGLTAYWQGVFMLDIDALLQVRPNGQGIAALPAAWLYRRGWITPAQVQEYAGDDRELEADILMFVPPPGTGFDWERLEPVYKAPWVRRYR